MAHIVYQSDLQPTMAARSRHRIRKRTCIIVSLILALSLSITGEARIPQHRVKRGTRQVTYQEANLNDSISRFWIPDSGSRRHNSRTESSRFESTHSLQKESSSLWYDNNDVLWHFHVDANQVQQRENQRRLIDSSLRFGEIDSVVGFEQGPKEVVEEDPDQDSIVGKYQNQTYNVSTVVEVGVDGAGDNTTNTTSVYSTTESSENTTSASTFQPMRIRVILSEKESGGRHLKETERSILFQDLLSPAILAWSAALRVNPVVGNLTVDPSQLSDGVSCGPGLDSGHPSVVVPPEHMTIGLSDTDFVVYLSLSVQQPTSNKEDPSPSASSTQEQGGSRGNISYNDGFSFPSQILQNNVTAQALPLNNTDLYCAGDYLAAATYCSTDQNDRPTAALMHLCIGGDFFEKHRIKRNIVTVMHELGHSLGFNPQSMAHFRDSDGSPITERDDDGNVVEQVVECAGPISRQRFAKVALPSERILQFNTVRGGVRVAQVVTPSVTQVARNHFDCQTLNGAELESGDLMLGEEETTASCIGDHWERRLFRTDLMNAIVDEVTFSLRISPVTLALFADSGWYQVDLSRTAYSESWGRGANCSFVNDDCISPDGDISESNEPFFCNQIPETVRRGSMARIQGCSPDRSRKALCSIAQFENDLPSEYQYFNSSFGANVGGNEPLIDYCPVYSGFSDGVCKESSSVLLIVSGIEEFGLRNSRCLSGHTSGQKTGLCVQIACVVEDRSLRVKINGRWMKCEYTGQDFTANDGRGTRVLCPDVISTCPTFYCDRDCLGSDGVCDYTTGQCICSFVGENSTALGRCGEIHQNPFGIFYEDPLLYGKKGTESRIAEDSPLADYYVPNERQLKNRRHGPLTLPYIIISILMFVLGVIAAVGAVRYKKNADFHDQVERIWNRLFGSASDDNENTDESYEPSPPARSFRVGKDKFVASLLVNLRVHTPQNDEGESLPGTAAETDSAANVSFTNYSQSELDMDDMASVSTHGPATEGSPEEMLPSPIIRRRFKTELV